MKTLIPITSLLRPLTLTKYFQYIFWKMYQSQWGFRHSGDSLPLDSDTKCPYEGTVTYNRLAQVSSYYSTYMSSLRPSALMEHSHGGPQHSGNILNESSSDTQYCVLIEGSEIPWSSHWVHKFFCHMYNKLTQGSDTHVLSSQLPLTLTSHIHKGLLYVDNILPLPSVCPSVNISMRAQAQLRASLAEILIL